MMVAESKQRKDGIIILLTFTSRWSKESSIALEQSFVLDLL